MVCAICLAIPDMGVAASQGWSMFYLTMDAVLPNFLKEIIYLLILASQFLCGLATVTSASRMLFAFSRDGGLPVGSKALATVSPKYRTPVTAIWTAAVLEILYVWAAQTISIGGTNVYTIVVNSTLIFLFLSFAIPLTCGLFAYGTKKWPTPGPWAMSAGVYKLVTVLSMIGMVAIFYVSIQPPNDKVLPIVAGFIALALVIWVVFENRRFQGPPIGAEVEKRKAAIAAAEAAVGQKS
jgi:amino acid transporter